MDMRDFPARAAPAKNHRFRRRHVDLSAFVRTFRTAFGRNPGDSPQGGSAPPRDAARHRLRKGCIRAKMVRSIFGLAALRAAGLKNQCVVEEEG